MSMWCTRCLVLVYSFMRSESSRICGGKSCLCFYLDYFKPCWICLQVFVRGMGYLVCSVVFQFQWVSPGNVHVVSLTFSVARIVGGQQTG